VQADDLVGVEEALLEQDHVQRAGDASRQSGLRLFGERLPELLRRDHALPKGQLADDHTGRLASRLALTHENMIA
jgi:hypothetical protein